MIVPKNNIECLKGDHFVNENEYHIDIYGLSLANIIEAFLSL